MRIPTGTVDRYIYFVAVDATDLKTRETGLTTFTVYASKNGAAAAAFTTPTINETDATNMPGVYELLLDEQTTLTAGNDTEELCVHITQASMAPVTRTIEIYRPEITEGNTLGVASDGDISGNLDGTVATVTTLTGHTAQTGDNYARLGAPAGASVSADIAAVKTDTAAVLTDTADMQPKLGAPAGADMSADIAAVKSDTAAILVDTANMQPKLGAPAGADISADIAAVKADTAAIGAAGAGLTDLGGMSTTMKTQINAEVLDVIATDTITEPAQGAPPTIATATIKDILTYLYMAWRNKTEQNSTTLSLYDDAGSVILTKATVSDDATTATKGEFVSGA